MALTPAQLVVAEIEGNPPKPGRELALRPVFFSAGKNTGKGFLLQILSAVQVTGHTSAKAQDRLFPSLQELNESCVIVLHLDAPHRLLIVHRERRSGFLGFKLVHHGLSASHSRLAHRLVIRARNRFQRKKSTGRNGEHPPLLKLRSAGPTTELL